MNTNPQPSLFDSHTPGTLTVAELTGRVKYLLEDRFSDVKVEGEISNFKRHSSGHCYFTLKDAEAQIRCVMWRGMTRYLFFKPSDGMMVRVHAGLSVYEARGEYQLVVRQMKPAGEGALSKAFEELKRKLQAEGLFDESHKKPLPRFPERIGIVTSETGAALQDMLSILSRRFPQVEVLLCPVQVQGFGAADEIAAAVEAFSRLDEVPDVLVVARGGGSAEDLWAFNEETVARAIFRCRIPVVSAVGHETDFTISDFVADRRAATPSMAAELVVPDRAELTPYVRGLAAYQHDRLTTRVRDLRRHITSLTGSYAFNRPVDRLRQHQQRLDELAERMTRAVGRCIENDRRHLDALSRRLFALDPMRPLQQGYAIVERDGLKIHSSTELSLNDAVRLRFKDGSRDALITSEGNKNGADA